MKDSICADEFLEALKQKNILGGIKIDNETILVTTTEFNDIKDIELYLNSLNF